MSNRKIISDKQIHWKGKENSRLSYQMIFEETPPAGEIEKTQDVEELLEKSEKKWLEKLSRVRQEAYQSGLNDGLQQGREQAMNEIDSKLERLEIAFRAAHDEWLERQRLFEPGFLDLVFDISESILGIPVENPAIRKKLDSELAELLRKVDEDAKPVLWVSQSDLDYINKLRDANAPESTMNIRISNECNPGEFKLETNRETVLQNFRMMLVDLKDSLTLPSWKQ